MTQRDCDDCYYSKLDGEKEPCKSCEATDDGFTNFREVPLTNADRIRAMSDEELADFLAYTWATSARAWQKDTGKTLHWLQMPAEEDDHE